MASLINKQKIHFHWTTLALIIATVMMTCRANSKDSDSLVGLKECRPRGSKETGKCVNLHHCNGRYKPSVDCKSPTGRVLVCCIDQVAPYKLFEAKDGECGKRPDAMEVREMVAEPIVGGKAAQRNDWPWMVPVYLKRHYICGGSLITNRCVLTAAHCFESENPDAKEFFVRLGEHNLFTDGQDEFPDDYSVEEIIIHPGYRINSSDHDMALIILPEDTKRMPVCLPSTSDDNKTFVNVSSHVAGWGTRIYDANHREPLSPLLNEVEVPVLKLDVCDKNYKLIPDYSRAFKDGLVPERYMCAGYQEGGKDACLGDSGGPLVAELDTGVWTQIGVVTIGFACGTGGFPGIYTRVTHYLPWINQYCFNN